VALVGRDVFLTTLWLHPWLNKSQKLILKNVSMQAKLCHKMTVLATESGSGMIVIRNAFIDIQFWQLLHICI